MHKKVDNATAAVVIVIAIFIIGFAVFLLCSQASEYNETVRTIKGDDSSIRRK